MKTIGMGTEKKEIPKADTALKKENKKLTARVAELEKENEALKAKVFELEKEKTDPNSAEKESE